MNSNQFMPQFPNMNIMPGMPPFAQPMQYPGGMGGFPPMMGFPTFAPSPMTFNRNIFQPNPIPSQGYSSNYMGPSPQKNIYEFNQMNNNDDECLLQ